MQEPFCIDYTQWAHSTNIPSVQTHPLRQTNQRSLHQQIQSCQRSHEGTTIAIKHNYQSEQLRKGADYDVAVNLRISQVISDHGEYQADSLEYWSQ